MRETGRQVIAEPPNSRKVSSPAASSRSDGHKPSAGAAQLAIASTSKVSPVGQQHTASIGPTTGGVQPRAKLTPTPDLRPTTIEGGTVREVIDGRAVLEGPLAAGRLRAETLCREWGRSTPSCAGAVAG
jgi:hypothetical protein